MTTQGNPVVAAAWLSAVRGWVSALPSGLLAEGVTAGMAVRALGLEGLRRHEAMVGKALRELGLARKRCRGDGRSEWRYFPPAQAPSGGLDEATRGDRAPSAPKARHEALASGAEPAEDDAGWPALESEEDWRVLTSELARLMAECRPKDAAWRRTAKQRASLHARGELPFIPMPDRGDEEDDEEDAPSDEEDAP